MTNPLKQKILRMIAATGPISIAEYMHLCHSHPEHGYYADGNPVGKMGDFITAPEISQMFGELIAIWCIQAWQAIGSPVPVQIAELGPGRGTLMRDFLRAAGLHSNFAKAIKIKLVETSPSLTKQQHATLGDCRDRVEWLDTIDNLEPVATLFIANEFLDAIPFRQFVKTNGKWLEHRVGIDDNNQLAFVTGPSGVDEQILPPGHDNEPDGAIFETAPAREAITAAIAAHVKAHGGAALFIDYGHEISGFGDTFQAVQSHQPVSLLADPGNSDLTSHVDFQAISDAAIQTGLQACKVKSQRDFLLELGLLQRAGRLGQGKSLQVQEQIHNDVERLVSPQQMGTLFKVLCLTNPGYDLPPFGN